MTPSRVYHSVIFGIPFDRPKGRGDHPKAALSDQLKAGHF